MPRNGGNPGHDHAQEAVVLQMQAPGQTQRVPPPTRKRLILTSGTLLEVKADPQLNVPSGCRAGNRPKPGCAETRIRAAKIRMVKGVEEFRSELEARALLNCEILVQREVKILEPWPCDNPYTSIPKGV